MGFWDFIAPDKDEFVQAGREFLPAAVAVGPIVLSQDELTQLAYLNPASGLGLAVRLYWGARAVGLPRVQTDALWAGINDQATSAGFGSGPGGGGSFGWEAIKIMPTLIIPDAFRVAIEGQHGGRPIVNVLGVVNASGDAAGAAAAVQTAWKTAGGPLSYLPGSYSLTGFRATDLSSATGDVVVLADSQAGGGAAPGSASTNAASALIKMGGGSRSRSGSGRMYFGPLTESYIGADGRTLDNVGRTNLQDGFNNFRNALVTSGYTLAVLSPTLSIATPVSTLSVQSVIATQRRRIRG